MSRLLLWGATALVGREVLRLALDGRAVARAIALTRRPLVAALALGVTWTLIHAPYFFMKGGHSGGFTPRVFALSLLPLPMLLTRTFSAARDVFEPPTGMPEPSGLVMLGVGLALLGWMRR